MEARLSQPFLRASSMLRASLCSRSAKMEFGLPEEDSEDAKLGVLLHAYSADKRLVRSFLKRDEQEILTIADNVEKQIFSAVEDQFRISDESYEEGTEKELWVLRDGKPEISGHCDKWRFYPGKKLVAILDHKFGRKIVAPAAANLQLRTYAVGAADEWNDATDFLVGISQPRLSYSERCTIAHYDRQIIEDSREQLLSILDVCRSEDAELIPGAIQCQYCRAKLICPAFKAEMEKGFALVPAGDGTLTKRKADVGEIIARASDEDLDKIIQFVRQAKFVEEMAINEGRARVEEGKLSMYELGKASQPRYIADPGKAYAALLLRGLANKTEVWNCATMALGKVEDLLAAHEKISMKEARKLIESILGDAIQREERKPSLIRKT